jgi:hypothetical protein
VAASDFDDPARPDFQKHGKQDTGVVAAEERIVEVKPKARRLIPRKREKAVVFRKPFHH